ncbi:hypothetical protein PMIN04_012588 [Paraphaeosphaeria minitans]|uniref:Uncharacterized protein n=1 Tax=Paraphaeosphaeria minitans TaxID=565426 RepID=A0A9P6G3L2_9PLEO|nr:hypothetical protein PMIN01_13584 [Paraphaeosphaeria minitans]
MPLIPPPKAIARKDAISVANGQSTTSGVEALGVEGQRRRKKSGRQMHEFKPTKPIPKPRSESEPAHPVIAYFKEYAGNQADSDLMFLLWGSADSEVSPTYAVDVTIPDSLKKRANYSYNITPWIQSYGLYYAEIGLLRRYLFFRKVARMKFQFISRSPERFEVSLKPVDLSSMQEELNKTIAEKGKGINWKHFEDPDPDEDPSLVCRCEDCGHRNCESDYTAQEIELDDCPGRQKREAEAKLRWVENSDLLTFYFRSPPLSLDQEMLTSSPCNLFQELYVVIV